jgi:hypothetical protein
MFPTLFGTFGSRRANVATDRSRSAETGAQDAAVRHDVLSLEEVRLVIEDGLLMVLGPEGDPVPPEAFRAAVSANADARVSLDRGGEVSAEKARAVLEAQTKGTLVAGEKTDSWILAMLGVGPQPEMAPVEDLQAETDAQRDAQRVESEAEAGQRDQSDREASVDRWLSPIPLAIVSPCPEGLEPAQVIMVALSGLPDGSVLSAGSEEGHGRWLLSPTDLDGLLLQVPHDCPESVLLKITAIAITGQSGDLASAQADLRLDCRHVSPLPMMEPQLTASALRSISVDLDPELFADPANDVLVVRGVPANISLSAGVYDGSISGWVLRPAEASGLRIEAAVGSSAQFTITILGISLTGNGPRPARVLASIPLALD